MVSHNRRTASGKTDIATRTWRVAALLAVVLCGTAEAQALRTVRLAGGETKTEGRVLTVTGGYVDPRTGRGRVEHGGRVVRLGANVRRVRTSSVVTRVVARVRGARVRMRLHLAQFLIAGGRTTLRLDPATFGQPAEERFRITGGRLDADTFAGDLGHRGALPIGPVVLGDIGVRPGDAVSAQVGDVRPDVGTLAAPEAEVRRLRLTIGPMPVALTQAAADGLNQAFETDRFRAGMPLGTLLVRARLRG